MAMKRAIYKDINEGVIGQIWTPPVDQPDCATHVNHVAEISRMISLP